MWLAGDKFRETNQWISRGPDDPSDNSKPSDSKTNEKRRRLDPTNKELIAISIIIFFNFRFLI